MRLFPSKKSNRKGIIIFIVLGTIFVLTILVMSYNYFVRGKFNESREILKHLRVSKCAQATCNYIFSRLQSDLRFEPRSPDDTADTLGLVLRNEVFRKGTEEELRSAFKEEWLEKIDWGSFVDDILEGTLGDESPSVEITCGFSDIKQLNNIKGSNTDEDMFFFDFEKVGRITIRVEITIGHSREVWQETRPFKVIFPFPVPVTKFSLYWKDGVTDRYAFNTVSIDGDTGLPVNNSRYPFLIDNGYSSKEYNSDEEIWMKRGWIYVGGYKQLLLNRACGDRRYGQRFYSYPRLGDPTTLMLSFEDGDKWDSSDYKYKNETLGFRVAHWGFSSALTNPGSNEIWRSILKGEYLHHPVEINKTYWNSSCLHLFSDIDVRDKNVKDDSENIAPTITRVIGDISDRYMEIGYLLPVSSSEALFAAVINYSYDDFNDLAERKRDVPNIVGMTSYTFKDYLFFPGDPPSGSEEMSILENYFNTELYMYANRNKLSYENVMSKIVDSQGIDITYNVISQYSSNQEELSLPPKDAVPPMLETKFWPQTAKELKYAFCPDKIQEMDVKKIGNYEDTTLGLGLRKCYSIKGTSQEIQDVFNSVFTSKENGIGWNLNNSVIEVISDNSGEPVDLGNNINLKSPGAIYRKEGPLKMGTFTVGSGGGEATPLFLLAGKGSITINNSGNNEVRAYLVALGEDGKINPLNNDSPLLIKGGLAVKEFSPENIPVSGGYIAYNTELDPTDKDNNSFKYYIGVVLGPKGGRL